MSMNKTCPISNFTPERDLDGIGFVLSGTAGFNESISANFYTTRSRTPSRISLTRHSSWCQSALDSLVTLLHELAQIVASVSGWLVPPCNKLIDNTAKFFGVPMSPRHPPLLYPRIGNQIAHCSLDLAPSRRREQAVAVGEIHSFEVV